MVAKGEDGKTRKVPGLILETRDDVRRYLESVKRIKLKKRFDVELDNEKSACELEEELWMLEGRRCKLAEGLFPPRA